MNHRLVAYSPEIEGFGVMQPGPLAAVAHRSPTSNAGVVNEGELLELAAEAFQGDDLLLAEPSAEPSIPRTACRGAIRGIAGCQGKPTPAGSIALRTNEPLSYEVEQPDRAFLVLVGGTAWPEFQTP